MVFITFRWLVAAYTSLIGTMEQAVFLHMSPNVTVIFFKLHDDHNNLYL